MMRRAASLLAVLAGAWLTGCVREAAPSADVAAATGFFRVGTDADGRWWAFRPDGTRFVPIGIDHVKYDGFVCEALGFKQAYKEANVRDFGGDERLWAADTAAKLKAWGFNLLGPGANTNLLKRGFAYTRQLPMGAKFIAKDDPDTKLATYMPNMFSPKFPAYCDAVAARECAARANDEELFGYFLDNEIHWWGAGSPNGGLGLFDAAAALPATHSARQALMVFLAARGVSDPKAADAATREAFVLEAARRFFSVTTAAIRKYDSNHLILGVRFAGLTGAHEAVWRACGEFCDVCSFNCYPYADLRRNVVFAENEIEPVELGEAFRRKHEIARRPLMVTEWSFPALDAGLPCTKGCGQRVETQADRRAASVLCAQTMLSLPFLIGYDYFMWVDEPPLGVVKGFMENSNYGLVSEDGKPYAELTQAFAALHCDPVAARLRPPPARRAQPEGVRTLAEVARAVGGATASPFRVRVGSRRICPKVNFMVAFRGDDRKMRWCEVSRVTEVVAADDGTLTVTGEGRDGAYGFRAVCTVGGLAWLNAYAVSLVSLSNIGEKPLAPEVFYFQLFEPFAAATPNVPAYTPNVYRRVWRQAWHEPEGGRFSGLLTWADRVSAFLFWKGANGKSVHPDAGFFPERRLTLAPGEAYAPAAGTVYVIGLTGTGGADGWREASDRLNERVAP